MEKYTIQTAHRYDEYRWEPNKRLIVAGQPLFRAMDAFRYNTTPINIYHYVLRRPEYITTYNDYFVRLNRKTSVQITGRTIQFSLNLGDSADHNFVGVKRMILGQNQCNFIALSHVNSDTILRRGQNLRTMDVHLGSIIAQRLHQTFPRQMDPLINALETSTDAIMYPEYMNISAFMLMLEVTNRAEINTLYPDFVMIDKIINSLLVHGICLSATEQIAKKDIARFELVKKVCLYITKLIDENHDLETMLEATLPSRNTLAAKLISNRTTLNEAFNSYMHKTIFAYWEELKMDKLLYMCVHEKEKHIISIIDKLKFNYLQILSKKFVKYGVDCKAFIGDNRIISPFPNYNF